MVMFFRLCNSLATFQAMMNDVFQDMLNEGWIVIYMDDILIFSKDLEEHKKQTVRGLIETPLFIHVYTGGCWIYSQSAISETPSLTYYLQYT